MERRRHSLPSSGPRRFLRFRISGRSSLIGSNAMTIRTNYFTFFNFSFHLAERHTTSTHMTYTKKLFSFFWYMIKVHNIRRIRYVAVCAWFIFMIINKFIHLAISFLCLSKISRLIFSIIFPTHFPVAGNTIRSADTFCNRIFFTYDANLFHDRYYYSHMRLLATEVF